MKIKVPFRRCKLNGKCVEMLKSRYNYTFEKVCYLGLERPENIVDRYDHGYWWNVLVSNLADKHIACKTCYTSARRAAIVLTCMLHFLGLKLELK